MYIPHPENGQIIYLPTEQIISEYEVSVKFWKNGEQVSEMGIKCSAQKHCELIECTVCIQMLTNPQCTPKEWIIILVLGLYFILGFLIMICRILKFGLGGMLCIMRHKWRLCKIIGVLYGYVTPPPILSLRVFLKRRKWSEIIFFSMSIIFFFFKYFACLFCLFTYFVLTFHSFRFYIYHISLILLEERKMIDMEKKIISDHFLRLRKTLRLKIGGGVTYP
ncbi:unnamed protein product [Meloidogyne enterolobii]|uniref:Uncharacterized protein n=1 Tax=Meloidogyne enterolobii TaxID=390850 RepID=A0ACB0XU05_MELEN